MFGKFMAAFSGEKMKQISDSITQAVVAFDPETASDAQIALMDEQVDELSVELAKANQALEKERREAEAAKTNFNKKVEAAKLLQTRVESATGAKKKSLQASLEALLEDINNTRDDVQLEIDEAEDAQATVDVINETLELAVEKLKTARSDLKRAASQMKRAEMAQERAERQADNAARLAGVRDSGDGMNVALDAMRKAASEAEANAAAAQTKADMLKPFDAAGDDNIAAIMAELDGEVEQDTASQVEGLKGF